MKAQEAQSSSSKHGLSAALLVALTLLVALGAGAGLSFAHAASTQTLNNVQIQVQTTAVNFTSYYLTVYNSSGYPIVTSSSEYPGFGAMLPSGTFLFVVTANQPNYCNCCAPYATGASQGSSTSGAPSGTVSSSGPASIVCPMIVFPSEEYGYALKQISGPTSLTIQTSPLSGVPTSKVGVHVSYFNGTAASGVYVSASLIGGSYYYGGPKTNWIMSGQTGSDGSFTLVVPSLPVEVNAYISVPVNIPKSITTYQTNIGGQEINVTVYWQPTYVYLEGSALVIPPQTSASITLHVQQPYAIPLLAQGGVAPAPLGAPNAQGAVNSSVTQVTQTSGTVTQPQTISPFIADASSTQTVATQSVAAPAVSQPAADHSSSDSGLVQMLSIATVIGVALFAVIIIAVRRSLA